jgi:hypothetical protein
MNEPIKMTSLKFIRLVSGEDIVAETIEEDGKFILINPLKIVYAINELSGMMSISLMQWIFPKITESQDFVLDKSTIIVRSEPSSSMIKYYFKTLKRYEEEEMNYTKKKNQVDYPEEDNIDKLPELNKEELDEIEQLMKDITEGKRRLH